MCATQYNCVQLLYSCVRGTVRQLSCERKVLLKIEIENYLPHLRVVVVVV